MNNLKEAEKAYFAGLFDGEGHLGAYPRGTNKHPTLQIQVALTYEPVIQLLQETFGGYIYKVKKQQAHHKDAWSWVISSISEQVPFLEAIQPCVKIKEEHVAVALALATTKKRQGDNTPYTSRELIMLELLMERLNSLNKTYHKGDII